MTKFNPRSQERLKRAKVLRLHGASIKEAIDTVLEDLTGDNRKYLAFEFERVLKNKPTAKGKAIRPSNEKPAPVKNLLGDARKHERRQQQLTKHDL